LQTGGALGMQTLAQGLAQRKQQGLIAPQTAGQMQI
jgi:Tfp pilus assembly pilus retraction ATPase PilT